MRLRGATPIASPSRSAAIRACSFARMSRAGWRPRRAMTARVLEQEIAKFAVFLDAAPDRPRELDEEAIDALGADSEEGDLSRLVDAALAGDMPATDAELARLIGVGTDAIPIVRAFSVSFCCSPSFAPKSAKVSRSTR